MPDPLQGAARAPGDRLAQITDTARALLDAKGPRARVPEDGGSRRGSGARCSASTIPATMTSCAGRLRPPSRRHRNPASRHRIFAPEDGTVSTASSTTSVSSTGSCSTGWTKCSTNADQTRCVGGIIPWSGHPADAIVWTVGRWSKIAEKAGLACRPARGAQPRMLSTDCWNCPGVRRAGLASSRAGICAPATSGPTTTECGRGCSSWPGIPIHGSAAT